MPQDERITQNTDLPAYQQGLKVLGTPLGTNEFVAVHGKQCSRCRSLHQ